MNTASVNAEVTSLRAVFRTIAKGITIAAQSVEAVQAEIDKVLDAPPDPPIP
ncbi:MAG TPA: hypothetical protein VGM05_11110 [Planctomycetaceae bacterium]|jgi:hypothetical protein